MRDRFWLHIAGVWAIAVAQPILQVLAEAPEFFVAHHAGRTEILLLVAALVLVCPLLLALIAAVVGLAGRRAHATAVAIVVAAVVAMFAMQLVKQAGVQTGIVAVPAAAAIGLVAAILYAYAPAMRTFVTILALAIFVVPGVFLANPRVRRVMWPPEPRPAPGAEAPQPDARRTATPVVMVVLDELPLVSLLDSAGTIDAALYPNFAALARDGIWFRNGTTISDYTRWALPAIVSGQWPRPQAAPNAADHPETLFTLLGRTHRLHVVEAVTQLCPERLCGPPPEPLGERLRMIADDVRVLYLHILLTDDLKGDLPSLTANWANFGAAREANQRRRSALRRQRREARRGASDDLRTRTRIVRQFIAGIRADAPQPAFYFLHTMLPHTPHVLLPDGRLNATRASVRLLDLPRALPGKYKDAWTDDQWAVAQNQQRHLLQAAFVDKVMGELAGRLKEQGLYDRALVIVLADHGIAFRSGSPRRDYTPETAADVMRVPFFMKLPSDGPTLTVPTVDAGGQRVSDANVETIDIVPTIADVVAVPMPWKADGTSLVGGGAIRARKTLYYDSARRSTTFAADEPSIAPDLARKTALFGGAQNVYRVPRPPRFAELVGRRLEELAISASGGGMVDVDFLSEFRNIPADGAEVPFDFGGRLPEGAERGAPTYLAVAVNGVVAAVTHTWNRQLDGWLATPPLDAWRPRDNDVQVFRIEASAGRPLLRRCELREAR